MAKRNVTLIVLVLISFCTCVQQNRIEQNPHGNIDPDYLDPYWPQIDYSQELLQLNQNKTSADDKICFYT